MRQSTDNQIIVTPDELELAQEQGGGRGVNKRGGLDESLTIEPVLSASSSAHGSATSATDGYFDGVVGLKDDDSSMMDSNGPGSNSPYSRYAPSPVSGGNGGGGVGHGSHPYRRTDNPSSPHRSQASPTTSYIYANSSHLGPEGKSFTSNNNPVTSFIQGSGGYMSQLDGMLAPPLGQKMEKQSSADGGTTTWQRW